jgi:ElaB/YqjD/DUF883 family membrane-anchored ribosome-binding protein
MTKETISNEANEVRGALARGVEQVAGAAHDTLNSVSNAAQPALDRVAVAASQAAQTLGASGKRLKSAEQKLADNARVYVQEHPVTSLGIAFATGTR